jgi:non-ribosomal peptide synthetase component F
MIRLKSNPGFPAEQEAIRGRCFHPTGTFVEFPKHEIEQSIPERFEKIVCMYPDRIAVKTRTRELTYDALNSMTNRVARTYLGQWRRWTRAGGGAARE